MSKSSEQAIEDKILYILDLFPRVSPSMLQISLGSGIPTAVWHPVLESLIEQGAVFRYQKSAQSPSGRYENKTIISRDPIPEDDNE